MANPFASAQAKNSAPKEDKPAPTMSRPESSDKPAAKGRDPFTRPSGGGDQVKIKEDLGSLLVVRKIGVRENMSTAYGITDAVEADWLVCDGDNAGEVRTGSLIFQGPLVRDLKRVADGGLLVGRLMLGEAKSGQSAPYIFQDFTDEEEDLARECVTSVGWV